MKPYPFKSLEEAFNKLNDSVRMVSTELKCLVILLSPEQQETWARLYNADCEKRMINPDTGERIDADSKKD